MLTDKQFPVSANTAPILRSQLGSDSEWIADQREKKHEVQTLCCRRIIDPDGESFGDSSAEQRWPRDVTGTGG